MAAPTLNVVGCGRLGRTLVRLFAQQASFALQDVQTRSLQSALEAVAFVGAGRAVADTHALRHADVWMIATPDTAIELTCDAIAQAGRLRAGDIMFHCSGASPSAVLEEARRHGAQAASVHPIKSFADPARAVSSFAGTPCAMEGDAHALSVLRPAFESIGAVLFDIRADRKTIYHAASVLACNDLVALMEVALRCLECAGLRRDEAARAIAPVVRETVDNVFALGTTRALTGPVARGDDVVVGRQLDALQAWDGGVAAVYRALGTVTLDLSGKQGAASPAALARIARLLSEGKP